MFSSLTSHNSQWRVPVVRCCYVNCIYSFIFKYLTEVLLGAWSTFLLRIKYRLNGLRNSSRVYIAYDRDLCVLLPGKNSSHTITPPIKTNSGHMDSVIRPDNAAITLSVEAQGTSTKKTFPDS